MSIGQSNAVTPIQLLTAFSAISNGGNLMKPHIVREIRDNQGNVLKTIEPEVVRQVISPETSKNVMKTLETVVSKGTGKIAYIEGYRVGGKTGTAQKIIPGGGYSNTEYIPSFMGVAPTNDPQIVAIVIADNPKGIHSGAGVCAPVFQKVVKDTLNYLQIPSQVEPEQVKTTSLKEVTLTDLTNQEINQALELLKTQKLNASIVGEGDKVIAQLPLPQTTMLEGNTVVLYTKMPEAMASSQKIPVPELTGKSMEEIQRIAQDVNLNFEIIGEGIAMYQVPQPGTVVAAGSKVTVNLEKLGDINSEPVGP
jgi:stage V sporulation protein D (sporulation-specific penicillin-binding protein)